MNDPDLFFASGQFPTLFCQLEVRSAKTFIFIPDSSKNSFSIFSFCRRKKKLVKSMECHTARPHGTRPHWTLTLLGHCFGIGPKNFEIHWITLFFIKIKQKFDMKLTSIMSGTFPGTEINITLHWDTAYNNYLLNTH